MSKRGRTDYLSYDERQRLHAAIRSKTFTVEALARRFNLSERTVHIHKAKAEGRFENRHTGTCIGDNYRNIIRLCLANECHREPLANARFCEIHSRPRASLEPLDRMMAGR